MNAITGAPSDNGGLMAVTSPPGLIPAIGFLAVLQATLAQFVVHGVPLFLREAGHPAHVISLVYLVSLPYVMRFLWAPAIDRFGLARFGHFRGWIIAGHLLACCTLLGLSFLDPTYGLTATLAAVFVLMIGVATQMTATGGLMIEKLAARDRARGATIQAASAGLAGLILGAGVLFFLADLGWQTTILGLGTVAITGLAVMKFLRLDTGTPPPEKPAPFWSQFSVLGRSETRNLLGISVLVAMGLILTYGLKSIVLIDAGYSVSEAGVIGLVLGNAAGFCCALAARPLVERWGGFVCLAAIGILAAVYCLIFAVIFADGFGRTSAAIFAILANGLTFASFAASRTLIMERCAEGRKATEFAAFLSLEGICILLLAGFGNLLSDLAGFSSVLVCAASGSIMGAFLAWKASERQNVENLEREITH